MQSFEFTPYDWPEPTERYLAPTPFLDFEQPEVQQFTQQAVGEAKGDRERAVRLFLAVRDQIRYEPHILRLTPEGFRASTVVKERASYCIPKAGLLAACARACGIPAAVGLSDVVNHFSTPKMAEAMGGKEVFMHHGWAALYLEGKWVKAVPAFNKDLCAHLRVPPTEFDGTQDAVLQQYKEDGSLHMEYLRDHGVWSDIPYMRIDSDWSGYYPTVLWSGRRQSFSLPGM